MKRLSILLLLLCTTLANARTIQDDIDDLQDEIIVEMARWGMNVMGLQEQPNVEPYFQIQAAIDECYDPDFVDPFGEEYPAGALAQAISYLEYAQQLLDQGDPFGATQQLSLASAEVSIADNRNDFCEAYLW